MHLTGSCTESFNCQLNLSRIKRFQIISFYKHSGILLRLISCLTKKVQYENIFFSVKKLFFCTNNDMIQYQVCFIYGYKQ